MSFQSWTPRGTRAGSLAPAALLPTSASYVRQRRRCCALHRFSSQEGYRSRATTRGEEERRGGQRGRGPQDDFAFCGPFPRSVYTRSSRVVRTICVRYSSFSARFCSAERRQRPGHFGSSVSFHSLTPCHCYRERGATASPERQPAGVRTNIRGGRRTHTIHVYVYLSSTEVRRNEKSTAKMSEQHGTVQRRYSNDGNRRGRGAGIIDCSREQRTWAGSQWIGHL